jgi:hypothetical protein
MTDADVVIAGGGPTALMLAWAAPAGAPDPVAGLDQALRTWLGAPPSVGDSEGQRHNQDFP